jgi:transcriptional regulatory protein RtcR
MDDEQSGDVRARVSRPCVKVSEAQAVWCGASRAICRRAESLSEAGRLLFAQSRQQKKLTNDADRLRKSLLRFGLDREKESREPDDSAGVIYHPKSV